MSEKVSNGYSKHCLVKKINGIKISLYKSWDIAHGKGFFAHAFADDFKTGFGFHKTNKLTAVREALKLD